jgi:hypothetical protein
MTDKDFYGGLIRLHILHHAAAEPIFGLGIIEELRRDVSSSCSLTGRQALPLGASE